MGFQSWLAVQSHLKYSVAMRFSIMFCCIVTIVNVEAKTETLLVETKDGGDNKIQEGGLGELFKNNQSVALEGAIGKGNQENKFLQPDLRPSCCRDSDCNFGMYCTGEKYHPGVCETRGAVRLCKSIKNGVIKSCRTKWQKRREQGRCERTKIFLQNNCGYYRVPEHSCTVA